MSEHKEQRFQVKLRIEREYCTLAKKYHVALLLLLVLLTLLYQSDLKINKTTSENGSVFMELIKYQLKQATSELEALNKQHNDLINRVRSSPRFINNSEGLLRPVIPSLLINGSIEVYETTRRNIYSHLKELGDYINSKLLLALFDPQNVEIKPDFLDEINKRKRSVLAEQERLPAEDGYDEWRREETHRVSRLVQRRLWQLQHPRDCRARRKVVCNMDNCGFGCVAHHIIFCLLFAYATDRTLVLNDFYHWQYIPLNWNKVFRHVSKSCTGIYGENVTKYATNPEAKIVWLPLLRYAKKISSFPNFRPHHVPNDLAHRIIRFNGDPASWWIGQIVKYIFVPQNKIDKLIKHNVPISNFSSPVVGVHVRRTDKLGREAESYELSEYMRHVDEYYAQLELTRAVTHRSVYLATDEPRVIKEASINYSHYDFFYNSSRAELAEVYSKRHTAAGLKSLLVDLYSLASCDYVVCTFSSNICRLVYEMMQINGDASDSVHSLDRYYYYEEKEPNYRIAIRNHTAYTNNPDSVAFIKGDLIRVYYKNLGHYVGTVIRTNETGTIPWYKTVKLYELYRFPEYPEEPSTKT